MCSKKCLMWIGKVIVGMSVSRNTRLLLLKTSKIYNILQRYFMFFNCVIITQILKYINEKFTNA